MQVIGEIVQVSGNRAYLADNLAALKILDVNNPDNPIVLGSYATPQGLKYPQSVQVAGNMAYILSRGLQVVDLTNVISPTLRGFYPSEYSLNLSVAGSRAYLSKVSNEVELLDISDPDLPTLRATLSVRSVQAVAELDNRA